MSKKYTEDNPVVKIIEDSIRRLPFDFNDDDILILSEWGYGLYQDGWNNCKKILINKKK